MHISNEGYFVDRERHDVALRMIRHEARTRTIRVCTGLSEDRVRRLYKTYAAHMGATPVRRRRGKSPRQSAYFVRNARAQYESSLLASTFASFGLLCDAGSPRSSIALGRLLCDAYETHIQLMTDAGLGVGVSFEHAWFLLQLLERRTGLKRVRCRRCDADYLRDPVHAARGACPSCALTNPPEKRRPRRTADGEVVRV